MDYPINQMRHAMADDPNRKPAADRPANPGGDQNQSRNQGRERDKTLTEQEEDKAGGANRKTPGPIYDV